MVHRGETKSFIKSLYELFLVKTVMTKISKQISSLVTET